MIYSYVRRSYPDPDGVYVGSIPKSPVLKKKENLMWIVTATELKIDYWTIVISATYFRVIFIWHRGNVIRVVIMSDIEASQSEYENLCYSQEEETSYSQPQYSSSNDSQVKTLHYDNLIKV